MNESLDEKSCTLREQHQRKSNFGNHQSGTQPIVPRASAPTAVLLEGFIQIDLRSLKSRRKPEDCARDQGDEHREDEHSEVELEPCPECQACRNNLPKKREACEGAAEPGSAYDCQQNAFGQ